MDTYRIYIISEAKTNYFSSIKANNSQKKKTFTCLLVNLSNHRSSPYSEKPLMHDVSYNDGPPQVWPKKKRGLSIID